MYEREPVGCCVDFISVTIHSDRPQYAQYVSKRDIYLDYKYIDKLLYSTII